MVNLFRLPCKCGQSIPLDLSQAGQDVVCPACGETAHAPSLLNIKQLEAYEEDPGAKPVGNMSSGNLRHAFFLIGGVLLLFSIMPLIYFAAATYPEADQVLEKRKAFSYGGKELPQDSTPIPGFEQLTLRITDEGIDGLPPIDLYYYFLWLKQEQNFGGNFYENYQALVDAYYIRVVTLAILVLVGAGFVIAGFFMPKRSEEVTGWSGGEW